jgi:hypothetical protein
MVLKLMNKLKLIVVLSAVLSLSAQAEIYKYVDENGRITYSNIPKKGSKKLDLEALPTVPGVKTQTSTPSSFPRVDAGTQKKRDDSRQKILEEELASEEKQLADAKKALVEGEGTRMGDERNYQKYLDRIQKLKEDVVRHEKNVEALQKELSGSQDSGKKNSGKH